MFKKPCYLNHLNFLACIGTTSEPEITAQVARGRELKLSEDFSGIQGNGSKFAACRSSGIILFLIIQKLNLGHWMTELQS